MKWRRVEDIKPEEGHEYIVILASRTNPHKRIGPFIYWTLDVVLFNDGEEYVPAFAILLRDIPLPGDPLEERFDG